MFKKVTPESKGISSQDILDYIKLLNKNRLAMHSVLIARGNDIICEAYWKPFDENFLHRMYSQTKSYVGIAVALLAEEGKINLDDKIVDYFPDKQPEEIHPFIQAQTIKNMLTMQTAFIGCTWFDFKPKDRVHYYFNHITPVKYPGTSFTYDSTGSFVLSALVERVTGMRLFDYLRNKCLDEIGFSKEAHCLDAPGGYSWGDSALLCTSRDMLLFGRLLGNNGMWGNKQLISKEVVSECVKKHVDNDFNMLGYSNSYGYGYQIWRTQNDSFVFFGMHDQYTIYNPQTDILFVCTSGNFIGDAVSGEHIFNNFFTGIVEKASCNPLPENDLAYNELTYYINALELVCAEGEKYSEYEKEINNRHFKVSDNDMGITDFSLCFNDETGEFRYINKQGQKTIKFGRKKNIFGLFPQTGYSKNIGSQNCEGHMYKCAASAAWKEEKKLSIKVQIIDDYIGNLNINIGFNGNYAVIDMKKSAEAFLDEYNGFANAVADYI